MRNLPYDISDPKSIETYAKGLICHTFQDILDSAGSDSEEIAKDSASYGNEKRKGGLGNLLEEQYFKYKANSESEPDFKEAGVELKATPYEITQRGAFRAGERLVLSMINYNGPIEDNLYDSHVWKKSKLLLLIFYLRKHGITDNLLYTIDYVSLFTPSEVDRAIIENDYKYIAQKVRDGKAEELSEADTMYLGACTKGATAEKSIVSQFYPPHTLAKKRAFCYKNSYMTQVLNNYIVSGIDTYEPIVKNVEELRCHTFADLITSKINAHIGKTDKQLCVEYSREYNNNKAQWTDLAYRMLGIKSNKAEEFRKANITVKVMRIEGRGKMNENISFPPFVYQELINETWEESTLFNYFSETKFLFVIFTRSGESYKLSGCQLWNMPLSDLNSEVQEGWNKVVATIKDGVKFDIREEKNGLKVYNNFPSKNNNRIIHVRPHASKRYFEFPNGRVIGNGTRANANQLPDGTWMPNYSFWINNSYILEQLHLNK